MSTHSILLTEHDENFIAAGVRAGLYDDASDALSAGLRLLERQEEEDTGKLAWLRNAAEEAFAAFDRGEGEPLKTREDIDNLVNQAFASAGSDAARKSA